MADATTAAAGARVEQELEERFGISMATDLMAEGRLERIESDNTPSDS